MTKIELNHVSFKYNASTPVLKDVTFTMDHPGLYCIIGPNGVGKSTLVKCINKLLEPTEGDITIDGRSIKDMTIKEVADYVAGTKFRTLTGNRNLTDAQVGKIVELLDEVSPKGVFKEFNAEIRRSLKAAK